VPDDRLHGKRGLLTLKHGSNPFFWFRITAVQNFISRFRVADEKLLDLCAQPFGAEFAILRVLTKSFQLEESAVS